MESHGFNDLIGTRPFLVDERGLIKCFRTRFPFSYGKKIRAKHEKTEEIFGKSKIQHLLKQDLHFGFHPPYVQGFSCAPETSGSLDKFLLSKEHHTRKYPEWCVII